MLVAGLLLGAVLSARADQVIGALCLRTWMGAGVSMGAESQEDKGG